MIGFKIYLTFDRFQDGTINYRFFSINTGRVESAI